MRSIFLVLLLLSGCSGESGTDAGDRDAGSGSDAGNSDAGPVADAGQGTDGGSDGGTSTGCGTERPSVTGITGTEGLVIARDGTIYYSQSGAVGRMLPGLAPEDDFVSIAATTIWGLALDAANETLYVAVPGTGLRQIDLTAATPDDQPFAAAGAPNGVTVGPDGFVYYGDFGSGRVHRADPADGTSTEVTTSVIPGANGVAFEPAGTLLVASYDNGSLIRLTLTAGRETGRANVTTDLGSPDGVAVAADGTIFVGDQGGAIAAGVYRVSGATVTPVRTGLGAPANLDFGSGALRCEDLYVAVGAGPLERIDDVGPGVPVPWH